MKKWAALLLVLLLAACEEKKDTGWLGYGEGDAAFMLELVAAPLGIVPYIIGHGLPPPVI